MMSGAGSVRKAAKPVERVLKRELKAVSGDYEQDIIEYTPGFWAQYGWQSVLCVSGGMTCVLLWLFALSPFARLGDVWGMGPTLMFSFFMGPLMLIAPLVWYRTYRRQQKVLQGIDLEQETKVTEIMS